MAIAVGLLLSASVPARDAQWYSAEGEPLPDTEARKFVDGFGAWLLTTANTHWSDHTAFAQRALALAVSEPVSVVVRGQVISVLIFVMNPAPRNAGIGFLVSRVRILGARRTCTGRT